jgi:hypothetical protein
MRAMLVPIVLLFTLGQPVTTPELAAEVARIRGQIAASVPDAQRAAPNARLDRAQASLDRGRRYLAIYLLESAFETAGAFAFANASGVKTPDDFVKAWTAAGAPAVRAGAPPGARPALVDALAEAADGRAPATYLASRPYAEDAGLDAGVYYLGESRALTAFAGFARSLAWPAPGRKPAFRSIAPEIAALDAAMTAKYETMDRAEHPTYITASAALKQARTLNDAGRVEGALFEYLLARYLFAPLAGPPGAEATADRVAAAQASLERGVDHSIAEIFLQLADEGVSGSVPAQRRGAAAVMDDVLPAYIAAVAPPATIAADAAAAQVTITLVRWPFT